jgi:hypothetical protein
VPLERIGVVEPHHERGIGVVKEPVEPVGQEHGRIPNKFRTLAPVIARKD